MALTFVSIFECLVWLKCSMGDNLSLDVSDNVLENENDDDEEDDDDVVDEIVRMMNALT